MENTDNPKINISGLDFSWDVEQGLFAFEGVDSVLFWIPTAMKSFFDTIEEVSGEDASQVVFETTGFRQGLVVGEYFRIMKNVSVEEAIRLITNTYASAGWGKAVIDHFDLETKIVKIKLMNSWEHKINIEQKKKIGTNYLPAHYAGVFSNLFETNIWYKVNHYQLEGYDHTYVEYFPSDVKITDNIHELSRRKENEEIKRLESVVQEQTRELKDLVKEISSPIIPVLDGVVVVPLIGKYDEERSDELISKTMFNLPEHKARFLILDLTGLNKDIDEYTASIIDKIGAATKLVGTEMLLVGMAPELSMIMTQAGISLKGIDCFQTLQHGIYYALGRMGRKII